MTGHQINSLVGDLVAMAQAMERLPQVEARVSELEREINTKDIVFNNTLADLNQARSYAASLEAKVHAAEASRDDAELRFLELEEHAHSAVTLARASAVGLEKLIGKLDPPKPEPEPTLKADYEDIQQHQPKPIVSEVKSIAADPTHAPFLSATTHTAPAPIDPPQGQSEADPIANAEVIDHSIVQLGASAQEMISAGTEQSMPSWATPTPPKPQPYAGKTWTEIAATTNHYIGYNEWKEGGGTDENWNS